MKEEHSLLRTTSISTSSEAWAEASAEWNKGREEATAKYQKGTTIRVAILNPGQSTWEIREITHSLKGFQTAVGGLIKLISSRSGSFELYVNEDQGDPSLPPCVCVRMDPIRILRGPIVAFGPRNFFLDFELPITPESLAKVEQALQPVADWGGKAEAREG